MPGARPRPAGTGQKRVLPGMNTGPPGRRCVCRELAEELVLHSSQAVISAEVQVKGL